jgi:hypothetical protein
VRQLDGPSKRGLNRMYANLNGGFGGRGRGGAPGEGPLPVGEYVVTVDVAGEKLTKPARVRPRIGG